jgi:Helicase HerA, central domain
MGVMVQPSTGQVVVSPQQQRRTNATFWRRGTRVVTPLAGRPPSWWDYRAGVERLAVELAAGVVALGVLWLYAHGHRVGVVRGLLAAGAVAAAGCGWWTADRALTWRHRREVVAPLAAAIHQAVGRHEHERASRYLDLPADYAEPGARPMVIRLPETWAGTEAQRRAVEDVVRARLGLSDVVFGWGEAVGRRPRVKITPRHHPPDRVLFADDEVRQLVEAAPESAPLIGLAAGDRTVAVDLDAESPHVLVSASTGGGKSVILRALTAQLLHNGAEAVVIDLKRHSHRWCRGIPGVTYLRDVEAIHHALVALGAEGERRNQVVDEHQGDGDPDVGPRLVVVVEESNATIARLKRWWDRNRDKSDPRTSPAIDALADVLFMGRAVRMHVLLVAQSATANALGGPEVREQFAVRILARYSRNAWMMLAPEVTPAPPSTRHVGRAQVVLGGAATATQVLFTRDDEARAWALSGERPVTESQLWQHLDHQGEADVTVTDRPRLTVVPDLDEPAEPERFTLAEAARADVVPLSYDALRQAKSRDPEFPGGRRQGRSDTWTADQLVTWYRNRPRAAEGVE